MKKNLLVLFSFVLNLAILYGQADNNLSPQEKAYFFHTIRKSPILEHNIGRYVVYSGKEIKFPSGEINYDSIEQIIINNPELLQIYSEDIRRSPKGIIAELTNKTAIWKLNKALHSSRSNSLDKDGLFTDYERFEKLVISKLPEKALKQKRGEAQIHKRLESLSNPTLTFKDKVAILDGMGGWSEEDKRQVILAFNSAINTWVSERSYELFQKLGGEADFFLNILTAVGDGSSTSGLFEEREKDEKGRWNRGLPKAVGLFPYEPYIGINPITKAKKQVLLPSGYTVQQFETIGEGMETNIHVDVWGYNSKKQTTVVIEKSGKQYPLFGSEDSRFLTPDSAFGGEMTYYSLIHNQQKDIDELQEKISGKRGFDYWIAYYEKLSFEKKLAIDKLEEEIDRLRRNLYFTDKKGNVIEDKHNKKRKQKQEKVVLYFGELKAINKKLANLKIEKEQAVVVLQKMERRKQDMLHLIGERWVSFTEKDGFYLFADSTRFDLMTQEFTFPASERKETVQVRLLAIPISYRSSQYDEVMLHINVTDAKPHYTSKISIEKTDLFAVDKYELTEKEFFLPKDSIAVREFFEALLDKKKKFEISALGGVGKWRNNLVGIDYFPEELNNYPGDDEQERQEAKESREFKGLRTTEIRISIDRSILMEVNSYTDPVRSNFKPINNKKIQALAEQYKWSGNQILSAYRVHATLFEFQREIALLAGEYLSPEQAAKVIDRFNKEVNKVKISVGKYSVAYKLFP